MKTSRKLTVLLLAMFVLMVAALAVGQAKKPPAMVDLPASMGAVHFDHTMHMKLGCAKCHHPSKPEKPMSGPTNCSVCHTKPATPPVTTSLQAAFHNPSATAGTCIDCHKTEDAAGKKAPLKCAECHKKG